MIKVFFNKKENIFISSVVLISLFCISIGFLFLFFKTGSIDSPRTIPSSVSNIVWNDFSSKLLNKEIQYPEYMFINEQKESTGVGITLAEFEPKEFLTYFSNQNHVSIYPSGVDTQLFYGKTKESRYTSSTGQEFIQTEYLTIDNKVWAVMLVPVKAPEGWQKRGFIWLQTAISNKEVVCLSSSNIIIETEFCDPYMNQKPVYKGNINGQFLRFGYEVVNQNTF